MSTLGDREVEPGADLMVGVLVEAGFALLLRGARRINALSDDQLVELRRCMVGYATGKQGQVERAVELLLPPKGDSGTGD